MDYQRQIHLQRLAEQEAEMQARLDQQRRYAQQREQQNQVRQQIHLDEIECSFSFSLDSIVYPTSNFPCWLLSTSYTSFAIATTNILNGT